MEKMTIVFILIIAIYLIVAYAKSKKKPLEISELKASASPQEYIREARNDGAADQQETGELAAIVAAIAACMGDVPYRLKRIYAVPQIREEGANWRVAGRAALMQKNI